MQSWIIMGLTLLISLLSGISLGLSVVHCLKTISYIFLFSFIVIFDKRTGLVPVISSWPEVEILIIFLKSHMNCT